MRHRFYNILPLSALVALLAMGGAPRAARAAGVTVAGETVREYTVPPGQKQAGEITLRNDDDAPHDVRVYPTDYTFQANGQNDFGEPGKQPRSNAPWITFSPHQVTVPARGTATVYFTVQVPESTALVGTYWSLLMVEPIAPDALQPKENGKPSLGIRTVVRYAIQVITHINDTGTRELKFLDRKVTQDGKQRFLTLDVGNTGQRSLVPTVWVELFDANGTSLGRRDGNRARLYPGCSARFRIDLSNVAPGKYDALIVADNGDENVFGTKTTLDIPTSP